MLRVTSPGWAASITKAFVGDRIRLFRVSYAGITGRRVAPSGAERGHQRRRGVSPGKQSDIDRLGSPKVYFIGK